MKNIITTITKTLAVASLILMGSVSFANAASFDTNPSDNTGITSIIEGTCNDCGGQQTQISVDIDNPGDDVFVTVFTDFMARRGSSETVEDAEAYYDVRNVSNQSASSYTFQTRLDAPNAGSISDTVRVNGLPSSYKIDFVAGHIENTHGNEDGCPSEYDYFVNVGNDLFDGSGDYLGDLTTIGNSWCAQGTVAVKYRITNTETVIVDNDDLEVQTNNASNVTDESAQLNGRIIDGGSFSDVWFAFTDGGTPSCSNSSIEYPVNGTYDNGDNVDLDIDNLDDDTLYRYQLCAFKNGQTVSGGPKTFVTDRTDIIINPPEDAVIITLPESNVNTTSAVLNGLVSEGNNIDVFFAISDDGSTPDCSDSGQIINANGGNADENETFNKPIFGLNPGTFYRYRACGFDGGTLVSASNEESFTTPTIVVEDDIAVQTNSPDVGSVSAQLNGLVLEGENLDTYFRYTTNGSTPNCINNGTLINAGSNDDAGNSFDATISVTEGATYRYIACGEKDGDVTAGEVRTFTIDDSGNPGGDSLPTATTDNPDEVEEDSAELNGRIRMNDFDNGIVFYAYGQNESLIDDVDIDYDSYNDANANEDGDDFQVVRVDDDNDESGSQNYPEDISNLDEDERYYYRICVEYDNNGDTLECGAVKDFETDRESNNNSDDDDDVEIQTESPRNVTQTSAEMCADLREDGGSSIETFFQFRASGQNAFTVSPSRDRSEGNYCERVAGLSPNTNYQYRACTREGCGDIRTFRTQGTNVPTGIEPIIVTDNPTNVRSNSATLNSTYVANAPTGTCYFEYGRTASLGRVTRSYDVAGFGACTHNFTQLAANTQYCVRAVIETRFGTDRGATRCFNTQPGVVIGTPTPTPRPPVVITVTEDDDDDIDLSSLGLGLSLVRLDIDNNEEVVSNGERVEYLVSWQNISELDLDDLGMTVRIPDEIQVTDISRGRLDADTNTIYFTIDDLRGADFDDEIEGESGSMTVEGIVGRGSVGDLVTAEAELAYDNPVNDAQENARDYDVDEYGTQVAGVTASVFGLANITLLGWLVILLGLFIVFLVARWLYLEREELRAQAYVTGGYRPNYIAPAPNAPQNYGGYAQVPPAQPNYGQPQGYAPVAQAPVAQPPQQAQDAYYEPYRPNRG